MSQEAVKKISIGTLVNTLTGCISWAREYHKNGTPFDMKVFNRIMMKSMI